MKKCSKEVEIELSDGTIVETTIIVFGVFDEEFPDEKKSDQGAWLIDSWKADHDEDLGEDLQIEFDEQVEEIVYSEKWEWDTAPEADDEEDSET